MTSVKRPAMVRLCATKSGNAFAGLCSLPLLTRPSSFFKRRESTTSSTVDAGKPSKAYRGMSSANCCSSATPACPDDGWLCWARSIISKEAIARRCDIGDNLSSLRREQHRSRSLITPGRAQNGTVVTKLLAAESAPSSTCAEPPAIDASSLASGFLALFSHAIAAHNRAVTSVTTSSTHGLRGTTLHAESSLMTAQPLKNANAACTESAAR